MKPLSLLLPLFLAACGAARQDAHPAVEIRTVTVVKEVQRPCAVTVPTRPAPIAKPYPTDAVQLAAVALAKLAEWSGAGGYGDRAEDALRVCTKP